jgi:hypothetical protein
MLELGPRELLTLGTVLVGLASGWTMIRASIGHVQISISKLSKKLIVIENRTDKVENAQAIKQTQIHTIAQILSPSNLKRQSERDGAVDERLRHLELEVKLLRDLHNGRHMRTDEK